MPAELLNCPFCGAEAQSDFTFVGPTEATVWYIKCCNCESSTRFHATESGAVSTWNQRANAVEGANLQPLTGNNTPAEEQPAPQGEITPSCETCLIRRSICPHSCGSEGCRSIYKSA